VTQDGKSSRIRFFQEYSTTRTLALPMNFLAASCCYFVIEYYGFDALANLLCFAARDYWLFSIYLRSVELGGVRVSRQKLRHVNHVKSTIIPFKP
jgi:hypothetical protein